MVYPITVTPQDKVKNFTTQYREVNKTYVKKVSFKKVGTRFYLCKTHNGDSNLSKVFPMVAIVSYAIKA